MKDIYLVIAVLSGIFVNLCAGHFPAGNATETNSVPSTDMDLEITISVSGGFVAERSVRIVRNGLSWSAIYFPAPSDENQKIVARDVTGSVDKWPEFVRELEGLGVFESRNQLGTDHERRFNDGQIVTLEYILGPGRRGKYSSTEPCAQETQAGKKLCATLSSLMKYTGVKLTS